MLKSLGQILSCENRQIVGIEDLKRAIDKFDKYIETLILGSGCKFEKLIMEIYKEELESYGVDVKKIKHEVIVDEKGVTGLKGWEYEVNFYEANDNEVNIFEFVIEGDKDSVKQLLDRKLESMGKRVIKMFLVCHVIDEEDKGLTEKYGVTVIAKEAMGKKFLPS